MYPTNFPIPPLPPIPPPPGPTKRKAGSIAIIFALVALALPLVGVTAIAVNLAHRPDVQATVTASPDPVTEVAPPVTSTTTTTEARTTTTTFDLDAAKKEAFVQVMQAKYPYLGRNELISLGTTLCDTLRSYGGDVDQFALDMARSTSDLTMTGMLLGAAVPALCPQYQAEVNAFSRRNR